MQVASIKKSFRDLLVWQKAMDLSIEVYAATKSFPKNEIYSLANQLCRAAVSIPSNIAEGSARYSNKEFARFVNIARGSCAELETQIEISLKLGYIDARQCTNIINKVQEIGKMLSGLKNSLEQT